MVAIEPIKALSVILRRNLLVISIYKGTTIYELVTQMTSTALRRYGGLEKES